jgi:protein PhnA
MGLCVMRMAILSPMVMLSKDLKVKGTSTVLKKGTKVKSIRLGATSDGHEVDCKMDAGNFMLKASFLKKA